MAHIAIMVGISVGLSVVSSMLQPGVPKQAPIDRGKQDDLRFTIVEEGAFIPRVYGDWVRLGGNLFWGTPTQEYKQTSAGSSGGKKGRGAEPTTHNFSYDKSLAAYCCEGPIRSFLRIKEGENVLFDQLTSSSSYYEAESSGNILAGGASIIDDLTLLSEKKVRLPPGASVTFPNIKANLLDGEYDLGLYYQSADVVPITILVNALDDYPAEFPDSAGDLSVLDQQITLDESANNSIKITNDDLANFVDLDRIFLFASHAPEDPAPEDPHDPKRTTGIVNDGISYPADLDDASAFYNKAIRVDASGQMSAVTAGGGQAQIEFYLGTHAQPQSPTIVAAEGAENTPANRGLASIVLKDYQVQNGQLENLTFEVEPLLNDLADILTAEYKLRGALDSQLDFEALRGTIAEGLYIDRLAPLSETIEALKIFYNFNIVPADGKVKAVLRGGASCRTIPFHELLAHEEGEERPKGVRIEHIEATDLPGGVYVAWVSPHESKDFHNANQFVPLGFGPSLEADTLNFPLVVSDRDAIIAAGKRWLFLRHLQAHPHSFNLSPKHRDLIPTDVVTLELPQQTIDVEINSMQAALPGLVKAKALPENAGAYNQVGIGQIGTGTERRKVKYPANSLLYFADLPPLRDEDGLIYYLGLSPRGSGHWEGGYAYEEIVPDTDEFDRVDIFPHAATVGLLVDDLPAYTGDFDDLDEVNEIVLDLYYDDSLFESRPEADIRARDVNILIVGSGPFANVVKFTTATYDTTDAPFVRRVTLSGLLHGLKGTERGAEAGTNADAVCALLTDAIHTIRDVEPKLNLERKFVGVTVGQALPDVPFQMLTNTGLSWTPLRMTDPVVIGDASNYLLIQARDRARPSEQPAEGEVLFGLGPDWSNELANTVLRLPMVTGTRQGVMFAGTTGDFGTHQQIWIDITGVLSTGTASVEITADDLPGSPVTVSVPVTMGDSATTVAAALLSALEADSDIATFFLLQFSPSGTGVIIETQLAADNDPSMDFTADRFSFSLSRIDGDDGTTNHAYRNNAASFSELGFGYVVTSIQAIERDFQRFEFSPTLQYSDVSLMIGGTGFDSGLAVAIEIREDAEPIFGAYPIPDADNCPLSFNWTIPDGAYYDEFPEGTVKETWWSYGVELITRDGVDPGNDPFIPDGLSGAAEPTPAPIYIIELNGNELIARDKETGIQIVKVSLGNDIPYPMRLSNWALSTGCYLRNAFFGGAIFPSTILAERDQLNPDTWGEVQRRFYLRIRQVSRHAGIKGIPLDLIVPPL